ncbi:MAG: hypothetical protein LBO80_11015 [Treponema sp.]|jgi:hypothetical protein|nr:hypothetical protein [Treponema sp.]
MKKKMTISILLGLAVLLAACKTTPKPADTGANLTDTTPTVQDPNAAPPDSAALSSLEDAKNKAENARKQALYLEGQNYFPQDWSSAESLYQAGEQGGRSTLGEVKAAAAQYNAAAAAYDDITRKAIPLYAQAREDEINAARTAAIRSGIADISPDRFAMAEDTRQAAYDLYEREDYYSAAEAAYAAIDQYQVLKTAAGIYEIWDEIDVFDLAKYDSVNYAQAEAAAVQAVADYDSGNTAKAKIGANETLNRLNMVRAAGWEAFAGERRRAANTERQAALDLKANVAVRNEFNAALAVYNQGESAFGSRRYSDAVQYYNQSESMFILTKNSAIEKRRVAEEAIRRAEEKTAESDAAAQNAEKIIGGE